MSDPASLALRQRVTRMNMKTAVLLGRHLLNIWWRKPNLTVGPGTEDWSPTAWSP